MKLSEIEDKVLLRSIKLYFDKGYSVKKAIETAKREFNLEEHITEDKEQEVNGWRFKQIRIIG